MLVYINCMRRSSSTASDSTELLPLPLLIRHASAPTRRRTRWSDRGRCGPSPPGRTRPGRSELVEEEVHPSEFKVPPIAVSPESSRRRAANWRTISRRRKRTGSVIDATMSDRSTSASVECITSIQVLRDRFHRWCALRRRCFVAMVITADGTKITVGLAHGDTENSAVVKSVLTDPIAGV